MSADKSIPKPRVLIVEDEAILACDLESCLESFGYEVTGIASSAEEALRLAAASQPELAVMDIHIRGSIDGIEVADHFHRNQGPAVVFLTAHSTDDVLQRAKVTQPLAYLLKPYQGGELKVALEVALYRRRMEREQEELIRKLEQALAEVKTLRGLIPICAWCRKLRDDDGFWLSVEAYITNNTEAACTHGICPTCYKKQTANLPARQDKQEREAKPACPGSHDKLYEAKKNPGGRRRSRRRR